jgi:hypothetical protein
MFSATIAPAQLAENQRCRPAARAGAASPAGGPLTTVGHLSTRAKEGMWPTTCGERAVTDHPRFDLVKGPPDTAYRHYGGAGLVDPVLRLVDRWCGGAGAAAVWGAPALDSSSGQIEIHERPPRQGPVAERSAADELLQAHARLTDLFPDETFSRNFLLASGRTRKLQAGLLAAFLAVVVGLLVQTLVSTRGQLHFTERSTVSGQGRAP